MQAVEQKPCKGRGMEGWIARWYERTRRNDMGSFRRDAGAAAERMPAGSNVLEVAPGPGFFAIELAKLGHFNITGLDISKTFVELATQNARQAGVNIDFRRGSASAMPFADGSFDFLFCTAAFKNFADPLTALNEMHRVLRGGGEATISDLRKDASLAEIRSYVHQSGRGRLDAWFTNWTFRHVLLKRAYTKDAFVRLTEQSRFGSCRIELGPVGFEAHLSKPADIAAPAAAS